MNTPLADQPDGVLAARCLAGNERAFAEIMRRHKAPLHRTVARLIGDDDAALDVVQDAFVAAYRALRSYDADRPLRTWLYRIAINKARDWQRRRAVRRLVWTLLPTGEPPDTPDATPTAETVMADREELARVSGAITRLPAALREVLVLRTIEGMAQAEVAQMLGISAKAVEVKLYRARLKLIALLDSPY